MHPDQIFCLLNYSEQMKNSKDKKIYRMQMVQYARQHGIKNASRTFKTTVKTVKKWVRRFAEKSYEGLEDLSRAPKNPAHKISDASKLKIIELKRHHRGIGADQMKSIFNLPESVKAIRKIWRANGLLKTKRRKHKTKQNLTEPRHGQENGIIVDNNTYYLYTKQYDRISSQNNLEKVFQPYGVYRQIPK